MLNKTTFLLCYSLLEYYLQDVSRYIAAHYGYQLKPSDMKEQGIKRYKIYFKKYLSFDFPSEKKHWNDIISYSSLRNSIMHNFGEIDVVRDSNLLKYISENKNLSVNKYNQIVLNFHFVRDVLKNLRLFFNDFDESWKQWTQKRH
jgi:hypothetical protein